MNKHTFLATYLLLMACLHTPAIVAMRNIPVVPRVQHVQQKTTPHSLSFKERIKAMLVTCKQGIKKHARPITVIVALALYTAIVYKLTKAPVVRRLEELNQQLEESRDHIDNHETRLRKCYGALTNMRTWLVDMYRYTSTTYPNDTDMNDALLQTRNAIENVLK